jgi:hypothetical protein
MNVEIGAEAELFSEKEYINGIAVAVWELLLVIHIYIIYYLPSLNCISPSFL